MGNLITSYNPFSEYGRYNLKKFAFENKKNVMVVLGLFMVVLGLAFLSVYTTSGSSTTGQSYDLPIPKYGYGPFGFGEYIPPKNMMASYVANNL
jgi:hypothetical protein